MAAQFEVPALPSQSQSSDDSSISEENDPVEEDVRRRGKNYQYFVRQTFDSKEEFDPWWNDEKKNWIFQSRASNVNDMVETWFCRYASKYSNRRGYNCLARLRLLYPHHNNAVVVKRCENEHHHETEADKVGLTEAQKNRARQLLEHGFTAKRIHIQFTVYVVKPAALGPFFTCSCPSGSKKEPCKHSTMVMCALENTVEYPAQVTAKEMTPNRKRKSHAGRDPLAPRQNRYAAL